MSKNKSKKYWFSVVEEFIMNENAKYFRGGRIEVYDRDSKTGYAIWEARFWIPIEFYDQFRETFDFKESDNMPYINWDYKPKEKE